MAYKPRQRSIAQPNAKRSAEVFSVPAPIAGIDARNVLGASNPRNCLYAFNLVPDETGVRVRSGYREWATGLEEPVRTIIPYTAAKTGDSKLFVATSHGIYDATTSGVTPVLQTDPADWTLTGEDAGWGVFTNYVNNAGTTYCYYADSLNGLFRYNDASGVWVRPTDITGVSVENINFVTSHKLRLWFGVENEANGYYLGIDSVSGALTSFSFGRGFKHGGTLKGLYNWTVDGGIGVDDYLVAISSAGDVAPYSGSDPSSPEGLPPWTLRGSYFVGAMVKGARCASTQGGNLHILSAYGLISMSDLLRGVDPRLPDAESISAKIAPFLRSDTAESSTKNGWAVLSLASEGVLAVITPTRSDGQDIEYIYNLAVNGWGLWRDIPLNCINTWGKSPFIGTDDGRILTMDVSKDNIKLVPDGNTNGDNIKFSIMFSYSDLGRGGLFKRGLLIRPDFISLGGVANEAKFFYDYDTSEILTTPKDAGTTGYLWDVANWDEAIWDSGALTSTYTTQGGSGMGRAITIAVKGNALSKTILASADVFFSTGGGL